MAPPGDSNRRLGRFELYTHSEMPEPLAACLSECMLETLEGWGLHVGPSKGQKGVVILALALQKAATTQM